MMYRWTKIFQLSKTISRINFGFLNFRYKLKERPDTYFIVRTCFVLGVAGVFYYYYFQMLGQLYTGFSELGLEALFCRLALSAVGIEILLLLPVCVIQTRYTGEISVVITYISAAAILPHIAAFPLAVLVTVCLKIAMLLKRMRTALAVTGIAAYFTGSVIRALAANWQAGAEQDILNWCHEFAVPFPFYNQYISLRPGLKLFCITLVPIFVGGYYYLSQLVIGKKYAVYEKEVRIRSKGMRYDSSSKLKSYFMKECRTFFHNPVYVINGLFGIFITPFLLPLSFRISTTAESIEQIRALVAAPEFSFYAVLSALAVIALTSSINVVASSSFSREGANFWIAKLIPYPLRQQASVKALFSTSISVVGILVNCLIFKVCFHYSFIQIGVIAFVGTLFAALWNGIGVFIDLKHPKLDWTNETEAIKQNVNVILSILLCVTISIGYFFAVAEMVREGSAAWSIMIFLSCSLCILILLIWKGIMSHQE